MKKIQLLMILFPIIVFSQKAEKEFSNKPLPTKGIRRKKHISYWIQKWIIEKLYPKTKKMQ